MPSASLRRRNVISTAGPDRHLVGGDVGQLDREAATAVEVDTANTMGGLGE